MQLSRLVHLAQDPTASRVEVNERPVEISGSVPAWGATTDEGRAAAMAHDGLADVLSVESILDELALWAPPEWTHRVEQLRAWSESRFALLVSGA